MRRSVHELCWDKLAMARRLLERGVPMPESLITSDPRGGARFRPPARAGDPEGAALVRRAWTRRRVRRRQRHDRRRGAGAPLRRRLRGLRHRPRARPRRARVSAAVLPAAAGDRRRPRRRAHAGADPARLHRRRPGRCSGPNAIATACAARATSSSAPPSAPSTASCGGERRGADRWRGAPPRYSACASVRSISSAPATTGRTCWRSTPTAIT